MSNYLRFSIAYFVGAIAFMLVARGGSVPEIGFVWGQFERMGQMMLKFGAVIVVVTAVILYFGRGRIKGAQLVDLVKAFFATFFLHVGFVLIKTSLPEVVPFYADAWFADLDRALHGGQDPWVWTYAVAEALPMGAIVPAYFQIWAVAALCFPIFLAIADQDTARVNRFLILFVVSWLVLGNILALAGMSAGPVFYDRLYGTERFADLELALAASEHTDLFMRVQDGLWTAYSMQIQSIGAGISAFPSVHVAIAMVVMLYLTERAKWLAPVGLAFLAAILFLSVYSGYHYALDGYVSILVVGGLWLVLRHRQRGAGKAEM